MTKMTDHGEKRMRQRLKLPKRATDRTVELAYERGKRREAFSGALRRYMDKVHYKTRHYGKNPEIVLYGNNVFIFSDGDPPALITTWPLPGIFRRMK